MSVEYWTSGIAQPSPKTTAAINAGRGEWVQTCTGRQFWPADPRPEDIDPIDIAHHLSLLCRFGGACKNLYSVAEHSVYVSRLVPPEHAVWALLHDAAEAYLGDIVRPLKRMLYPQYAEMEEAVLLAIARRFNLPTYAPSIIPECVKEWDDRLLLTEQAQLMAPPPMPWGVLGEPIANLHIWCDTPAVAEATFLNRWQELGGWR